MTIQNELRRTKIKLKLLEEPNINWLLFDLIDTSMDWFDYPELSYSAKKSIVDTLKKAYLAYIKDHSPIDPNQQQIEFKQ